MAGVGNASGSFDRGYLLRQAMYRALAFNDLATVDWDNFAVWEMPSNDVTGDVILRCFISGYQNALVPDVEVGVTSRRPLID